MNCLNLFDRLLKCIGLSRASVTSYYAGAAAHNRRALELRIEEVQQLNRAYMKYCSSQADKALKEIFKEQLKEQNDALITALAQSRGAQWAYAPEPEVTVDPTL